MKKVVCGVLATLFALSFLSCRQSGEVNPAPTETPAKEPTALPTQTAAPTPTGTVTEAPASSLTSAQRRELENIVYDCRELAWELGKKCVQYYVNGSAFQSGTVLLAQSVKGMNERHTAGGTASVWHYTSFYAMTSRLAYADGESEEAAYFKDVNEKTYAGFAWYQGSGDVTTYEDTHSMTLYAVNRAAKKGSADISGVLAVYDDQMWIVRENLYSYSQTGDEKYLTEARYLADCCLAGWDSTKRADGTEYGGIPWGPGYASKHTCSNAPLISPLVQLYEILDAQGDDDAYGYLEWAERIYDFCYRNLRNENGTYGDMFGCNRNRVTENGTEHYRTVSRGEKDPTAYPYNTGAMLSGAAALYRATGDELYRKQGKTMAKAAYTVFCQYDEENDTYLWPEKNATVWFNLILLQGYIDFYPYDDEACETYVRTYLQSLNYANENYNRDGLFPRNFVTGWDEKNGYDENKDVMDTASVAQMYAMIAAWADGVLAANGY